MNLFLLCLLRFQKLLWTQTTAHKLRAVSNVGNLLPSLRGYRYVRNKLALFHLNCVHDLPCALLLAFAADRWQARLGLHPQLFDFLLYALTISIRLVIVVIIIIVCCFHRIGHQNWIELQILVEGAEFFLLMGAGFLVLAFVVISARLPSSGFEIAIHIENSLLVHFTHRCNVYMTTFLVGSFLCGWFLCLLLSSVLVGRHRLPLLNDSFQFIIRQRCFRPRSLWLILRLKLLLLSCRWFWTCDRCRCLYRYLLALLRSIPPASSVIHFTNGLKGTVQRHVARYAELGARPVARWLLAILVSGNAGTSDDCLMTWGLRPVTNFISDQWIARNLLSTFPSECQTLWWELCLRLHLDLDAAAIHFCRGSWLWWLLRLRGLLLARQLGSQSLQLLNFIVNLVLLCLHIPAVDNIEFNVFESIEWVEWINYNYNREL